MISSTNSATSEPKVPQEIEGIYPLTPLQQGMLFHSLYAPRAVAYVMQNTWTFEGDLQVEAFRQAWQGVVDRHTILRTRFVWECRDQPLQVVLRQAALPWEYQDWRGQDPAAQRERLAAYVAADHARGFDLGQAPLMRIALIRTGQRTYQFIWSYHHILLDGWCVALVLQDFLALYEAACTGMPVDLTAPAFVPDPFSPAPGARLYKTPDPTLGWSCLAQGGVTTYSVPGDHGTLFLPENLRTMAAMLETMLAAVQPSTEQAGAPRGQA